MTATDGAGGPSPPPGERRADAWFLDTAHFPRPVTLFVTELFDAAARRGFREATARYGLLLDRIEWMFVQRWAYMRPTPVWALEQRPSRQAWERLVDASPALAERIATSARVFGQRRWREDVRWWDERAKPALREAHLALQAVEPARLDDAGLARHLDDCRANLRHAIYSHHLLNVAPVIPAGDFLAQAQEWTGRPAAELVGLLRVPGPQAGGAGRRLLRLGEALRGDLAARQLAGDPLAERGLGSLLSRTGEVGRAARAYVDLVGYWTLGNGTDVADPYLLELPGMLLGTIAAAIDGPADAGAGDATGELRAAVPRDRRAAFDSLLAEARATHRLRDERAIYCDVWAFGLARRAMLAIGDRLARTGAVQRAADLVEAGHSEIGSLLDGSGGPGAPVLAARARYRERALEGQVPAHLGGPPRVPIPTDWLPDGAARTERAFRTYVAAMSAQDEPADLPGPIAGLSASPGVYEGRARVVAGAGELGRIERGDVLVTASTGPAINVVLPLVGAIVTDRGGMLSHAAIVAREFGIPAVVGTGQATASIPDGALVRVDATAGTVTVVRL